MMAHALEHRLEQLEQKQEARAQQEFQRWLRSVSNEELYALLLEAFNDEEKNALFHGATSWERMLAAAKQFLAASSPSPERMVKYGST